MRQTQNCAENENIFVLLLLCSPVNVISLVSFHCQERCFRLKTRSVDWLIFAYRPNNDHGKRSSHTSDDNSGGIEKRSLADVTSHGQQVPTNLAILYSHLVCFSLSKLSRNWTCNQQGKVRNVNSFNYIIVSVDAKLLMHFRCQNALVGSSHRTINSFSSIVFSSAAIHHNTLGCYTLNF